MVENQGKFKKGEEVTEQEEEIMKFFPMSWPSFSCFKIIKKLRKR